MGSSSRYDLTESLILPTLLFAALGGMTWAVRGSSGYGGVSGCIFAGVMWGTAWWYIAHDPGREQTRRYSSGWIVLAVSVGVGLAGAQGWMQWPGFFEGRMYTNYGKNEFVPIPRVHGFIWMFVAGTKWAGLGACLVAWCGSLRETRIWHWAIRIACGFGGAIFASYLYKAAPQNFLPLFDSLQPLYSDLENYPNLKKVVRDGGEVFHHMGFYLGFLLYEIGRRDWRNVVLIITVGTVNGFGWSLCQAWTWAPGFWQDASFNWWRCWESSGGISIGLAFGIGYFLVNRPLTDNERFLIASRSKIAGSNLEWLIVFLSLTGLLYLYLGFRLGGWGEIYFCVVATFAVAYFLLKCRRDTGVTTTKSDPNIQRIGLSLGLLTGLGVSIQSGLKGWFNIYKGDENYWNDRLWEILGPAYLIGLVFVVAAILVRPISRSFTGNVFPWASGVIWLVLIVQNTLAQLITGPPWVWNEMAFCIYYALLFLITASIILHFQIRKAHDVNSCKPLDLPVLEVLRGLPES
jgi:hypothetical protein